MMPDGNLLIAFKWLHGLKLATLDQPLAHRFPGLVHYAG